jgi:hypothetical protein
VPARKSAFQILPSKDKSQMAKPSSRAVPAAVHCLEGIMNPLRFIGDVGITVMK